MIWPYGKRVAECRHIHAKIYTQITKQHIKVENKQTKRQKGVRGGKKKRKEEKKGKR